MKLFENLRSEEMRLLRQSAVYQELARGQMLFREGDPAYGLYVVLRGQLEVYRHRVDRSAEYNNVYQDIRVALIEEDEVVGELGLVSGKHTRTAAVRAVESSIVFHITPNIIDLMIRQGNMPGAIRIMEKIVQILAGRLRVRQTTETIPDELRIEGSTNYLRSPEDAIHSVELLLEEKGIAREGLLPMRLAAEEVLFRQGDPSDFLVMLQEGRVSVLMSERGAEAKVINRREAPDVFGEAGFFSGIERMATVQAESDIVYTALRREFYENLKSGAPDKAISLLFAVTSLLAHLLVGLERRDPAS